MSLHDRQRIIDLLNAKLKAGQEPNISQDDINNIGFIYADDNEQPGTVTIITDIVNKLSEDTLKEIELIQGSRG
jgi:predicted nuclease with TOPRIM domain